MRKEYEITRSEYLNIDWVENKRDEVSRILLEQVGKSDLASLKKSQLCIRDSFYVEDKQIVMYSNNKTLTAETGKAAPKDKSGVELKKAGDKNVTINNGETISLDKIIDRDNF